MKGFGGYFGLVASVIVLTLLLVGVADYFKTGSVVFTVFLLLILFSFYMGIKDSTMTLRLIKKNILLGVFLSLLEASMYHGLYHDWASVVTIPIYLWAWLSMYQGGLYISTRNMKPLPLLNALINTLASIGTLSWMWIF